MTTVYLGFVRTAMTAQSTHPMPFLMEPEVAAARILRELPRASASIVIPRSLAVLARIGAKMPDGIRRALFRRVQRENRLTRS